MMAFSNQTAIADFVKRHSEFEKAMISMRVLHQSIYRRQIENMTLVNQVVFLLARLATEDYAEILVLCENGHGHGAEKLLRGLFERVVTVFYLHANPDEVHDWNDYAAVDDRKRANAIVKHFPDVENAEKRALIEDRYERVKARFMVKECSACGKRTVNFRWHKLSPIDMAAKVGLGTFVLPAYYWPTTRLHDTVRALRDRVVESGDAISFDRRLQPEVVDRVLPIAHGLVLNVLTKVVEHFTFTDLNPLVEQCHAQYHRLWSDDWHEVSPENERKHIEKGGA